MLVTTARKVSAVALGEPATDDATFNQPAAKNTTLDNASRRTAINRRPKVRLFENDFSDESGPGASVNVGGAGLSVDVVGLGGDVSGGPGGVEGFGADVGSSDIKELV